MSRQMKRSNMARWVGQEARAASRLGPLVLIVLLLVALFWYTGSAADSGLFQSSPVETPPAASATPTLAATATIIPSVTTAPTPGATAQPTAGPTTEPTAPLPTATVPPAGTGEVTPTQPPAVTNTPTPSAQPETVTPVPSPSAIAGEASPTPDDERYAEGESNLKFEWGMLFDSVALLLSYFWLCCGGLLFLAIPLMFVVLWVASKRRQEQEE